MKLYLVTIAPTGNESHGISEDRRYVYWTLRSYVQAKSKNDARTQALRKARKYLAERAVRIVRVEDA